MSVRNVIGFTLVVALLLALGLVGWQTAENKFEIGALTKSVNSLLDVLEEMKHRPDAQGTAKNAVTQKDLEDLQKRVEAVAVLRAANDQVAVTKLSAELAALKGNLDSNVAATSHQLVMLKEIATQDGAGGWIPALGNPHIRDQIRQLAREVTQPTEQPLPRWRAVRIENLMPNSQVVEVDGNRYPVAAHDSIDVYVPDGPVTTRLVGFEATKTWSQGAPDYFKRLIIDHQ